MERYYKIAGLTVKMDTFGRTLRQAEAYRCGEEETVDVTIRSRMAQWKQQYPDLPDEDCEYLSTGYNFYRQLMDFDGMMLHSSAVVVDGKAYLFTADPGTGKSTHTKLWLERFGDRAFILNDDKPAVRLVDGVWYAFGTPWSGKNDVSRNVGAPLGGIALLERSQENWICPASSLEAVRAIMKQVNRPKWADYRVKLMQLMNQLITQVPVWKLGCNMDPQAAAVAYEAMAGGKEN